MTTMLALRHQGRASYGRPPSARSFAWICVGGSVGISLLGYAVDAQFLLLCGALGAAALTAVLAPEFMLALFLAAGGIKAAPWLSGLPVDLTMLAAFGVLAAMTARARTEGLGRGPMLPAIPLLAGLTSLILLSVLWSPDPEAGFQKAVQFETFSLLALVAPIVLIRSRPAFVRLMIGLVGFGLLIAVTAVSTDNPWVPLVSAGGNEIQLGIFSAVGLIAAVGYLVMVGPHPWRLLWFLPAVPLAHTVLAAGSRGALISTSAALVFLLGRQLVASHRARIVTFVIASTAALILAVSGSKLAGTASLEYRENLFTTRSDRFFGRRSYLFDQGRRLAVEHPLGLGAAGYQAVTGLEYPHNILLELADEQGMLGVALFLGLFVAAWRARLRTPMGKRSPEVVLSGTLIVLVAVEALGSYDLNGNRLLWFALGLALALSNFKPASRSHGDDGSPPHAA